MNRPTTNGSACSSAIYSTSQNYLVEFGAVENRTYELGLANSLRFQREPFAVSPRHLCWRFQPRFLAPP